MRETIGRFSDRVENYVKYRPSYPNEMFGVFAREMNWTPDSVVADIGSGTGISAKPFLERGNRVVGVEPNAEMRKAAEEFLREFPGFESHDGTAERTNLPSGSIDLVIAAQAYHWFDARKASEEFGRILVPGGFVALIWNERLLDANEFLVAYEELLKEFANDYDAVRHDRFDLARLQNEFGATFAQASFPNAQLLDFQGLRGRMHSSSYMPPESDPRASELSAKLKTLFDKYAEKGRIGLLYQTNIFYTRL
ncbi:MAG: class I SAM-dependent methyltransferase [Acidobacteria bacterium]|nr:class I SAM-dependent methyltransferase [Acidobacteriota bacterium]MBK8147079.1 class I SAM-dependent methyltransferase [Acidobacteriota bacterium]